MVKRFIFDLDGTLLHCDFEKERDYFRKNLNKEDAQKFIDNFIYYLYDYEDTHERYEIDILSDYLTKHMNINITTSFVEEWIDVNTMCLDRIYDETLDILEYLKGKNYSLAVLTNWFSKTQVARLKNKDIYKYFDNVYAGDTYVKPYVKSYLNALGNFKRDECVIIGDNLKKDVLEPLKLGINALYYNPNGKEYDKKLVKSIDSFKKIKEMY